MAANRITYISTITALVFFYIYCDSYMPFVILLTALILPVLTFISGIAAAKKTEVGVNTLLRSVLRNEDIKFGVYLKNNSIIPVSVVKVVLTYTSSFEEIPIKKTVYTSLASKEEKTVYIAVSSPHCTIVECSVKKVWCSDAFGLFCFKPKLKQAKETVVVMPDIITDRLNVFSAGTNTADSDKFSDTQKGDDSSQVFEVREYVAGDDIRRIHWGLSSKQDKLIVKEYSKPIADDAVILLESGLIGENKDDFADRTDRLLTVFLTLADNLMKAEQRVKVKWFSEKSGNMFSYVMTSEWEVCSVIKQFLCDELSPVMSISLKKNRTYDATERGSDIYYIYDSSFSDIKESSLDNYIFIDVGQVDEFVEVE